MYNFSVSTAGVAGLTTPAGPASRPPRGPIELPRWEVLTVVRRYLGGDVDWYRARHGKDEGERRFFAEYGPPDATELHRGNMLMANGASALWQFALGNGTTSSNSALGSGPTYFNNAQARLYVGDGGIAAGSGTVAVTGSSTAITFSGSQSGLQGKYLVVTGDSTNGFYTIASGSGTSWVLASAYAGTTDGTAAWSYLTAESHSQTALAGSSNVANQAMDSTFPSNPTAAQLNAITGATNAAPIVLTVSGGDVSTNDIVQVTEVAGNTAANGMWVANPASSSSITLLGSTGNASYGYGGIVSTRTVIKFQSTYGPSAGNFAWMEWAVSNGTGGNKILLNRRVFNGGTKSGGSTSLQVGIGLG